MTLCPSLFDPGMADDIVCPTKKMTSRKTTTTDVSMTSQSSKEMKTEGLVHPKTFSYKAGGMDVLGKLMIKLVLTMKYIIYNHLSVQGKGRDRK